jgi:hypothetical protein
MVSKKIYLLFLMNIFLNGTIEPFLKMHKLFIFHSQPKVLVKSLEEKPGTLSKMHGFKWHSIIPYSWAKYMPEQDIETLPFSAVKVSLEESINAQKGRS